MNLVKIQWDVKGGGFIDFGEDVKFSYAGVAGSDVVVKVSGEFMLIFELLQLGVNACCCCFGRICV